ncbi:MAG TPA: YafY family protein [Ktedonobacteraceae bacterium]
MRADRLLSILLLLQSRGRMTARDLAEHLEVSERTIYRDIEALGMAGIPVYAERGPGGGCSLMDGYQTRLTGLTESEIRALFLLKMAGPLADLGLSKALDDALMKLTIALPAAQRHGAEQVRQRIYFDVAGSGRREEALPQLQTIQEAIWQERRLVISYCNGHNGNGIYCNQQVEPYGLVSQGKAWYLVGAVCGEDEKQVFSLARIKTATMSTECFARSEGFDLPVYWAAYQVQQQEKKGFKSLSTATSSQKKENMRDFNKKNRLPSTKKPHIKKPHYVCSATSSLLVCA